MQSAFVPFPYRNYATAGVGRGGAGDDSNFTTTGLLLNYRLLELKKNEKFSAIPRPIKYSSRIWVRAAGPGRAADAVRCPGNPIDSLNLFSYVRPRVAKIIPNVLRAPNALAPVPSALSLSLSTEIEYSVPKSERTPPVRRSLALVTN